MRREWETVVHSDPNGHPYLAPPFKLQGYMKQRRSECESQRWWNTPKKKNDVFQTQPGRCTSGLTETMTAHTRLVQVQTGPYSSTEKGNVCVCGGGLAFVIGSHPPTQTHKPQNVIQKPLFGLGLWLTLAKKWLRRCHCDSRESILFGTLFPCDQIGSHLTEAERPQGAGEAETAKD